MKKKVKFLKEYQGLFDPGEEMAFVDEVADYLVVNGIAELVKPKPKPAARKK